MPEYRVEMANMLVTQKRHGVDFFGAWLDQQIGVGLEEKRAQPHVRAQELVEYVIGLGIVRDGTERKSTVVIVVAASQSGHPLVPAKQDLVHQVREVVPEYCLVYVKVLETHRGVGEVG